MELKTKAQILADLYVATKGQTAWANFLNYADLGIPLSIAYIYGYIELKPEGENLITDAYDTLIKVLEIPDVEYSDLAAVFDAAVPDEVE